MNRTSTLTLLLAALILSANCIAQSVYVNNGTTTNYDLTSGDSLYITTGTYTGKINSFNSGAKITIASGATFQPTTFNNPKGSLFIYGTAKFTVELSTNDGFKLSNYGLLWATKPVTLNGNSQVWTNNYGATMKFEKPLNINNNNSIANSGTITTTDNVTMTSGSSISNKNVFTIDGKFTMNGAQFFNGGKLYATGNMTFNSGSTMTNNCRLITDGNLDNNSNGLINYGLLWLTVTNGAKTITNSGVITNGSQARVKTANITNNGTLAGSGYWYFTGTTHNNGTTGVSSNTTDTLKIYDVTRTSPSTIFDVQNGTVRPNTVYRVFTAPDTVGNYTTCSSEYVNIPLAITWNYFYVNQSNNTPVLYWSATQTNSANYEVQRSYDGVNFYSIGAIGSRAATTDYSYTDNSVNTQIAVVYYRIRGIEPNGSVKLTETRVIRFSNKSGITIQTLPNPFTSQFSINYESSVKEALVIRVYNMTGQLQITKQVSVSNGYNSIAIPEAASLVKGMYMVQVSSDNKMIATEKIIKQ